MIIKRYSPSSWYSWLSDRLKFSRFAYFWGMITLLVVIIGLVVTQNRITVTPREHFFSAPTEIKLSTVSIRPQQTIHYTLDGSTPTADSPLYQNPLTIEKTSMLQMATFVGSHQTSEVSTHPIFIEATHDLPIVSIVTDKKNLFDPETGIYTNFTKEGDDWERPANLTFFEPDGTLGFQKNIGLRIHGGGSAGYPQKSFRIYAGYQNHLDEIKYPLFPDLPYDTFNTFLLRAAGGDWEFAFMRDAVLHDLASKATDLDTQAVRPAVVYLNNEYWGIYYLRERIDQHYLANKYGLSKDKLSIIEIPHDIGTKRGLAVNDYSLNDKAMTEYNRLYSLSDDDCEGCPNYATYSPSMDMDNFRDYMLLEIYSGNYDWPFGNVKLWRYEQPTKASEDEKTPIDGRLRWIFYDLDVGLGFEKTSEEEMIKSAENKAFNRLDDERFPFRNVILSQKFEDEFVSRATELLNTALSEEEFGALIDKRAASIRSEMPNEVARWAKANTDEFTLLFQSVEEWERNVQLLKLFVKYRTPDLFKDIVDFYDLPGLIDITFAVSPEKAGTVSIANISKTTNQHPWTGTFFTERLTTIQANPNSGYVFDHWEGDIPTAKKYNDAVIIQINEQQHITAVFRKKKWYEYIYNWN